MHWLDMIKVADLMRSEVITLSPESSIREALETFESERVSGAPVVDGSGRTVGVLSAFDVAQTQHLTLRGRLSDGNPTEASSRVAHFYDEEDGELDAGAWSLELLGRETVGDWMHPRVIHVEPDTSLRHVCELMIREGIHRVLVMRDGRLLGLLSTMDVVSYLASGAG